MNNQIDFETHDIHPLMDTNHYWKEKPTEEEQPISIDYEMSNEAIFKKFPFISTILRDGFFWDKEKGTRDYVLFYDDMFFSHIQMTIPESVKNFVRLVVKGESFVAERYFKFKENTTVTELNVVEGLSLSSCVYECDKQIDLFIFEKEKNAKTKQDTIIVLNNEGSCANVTMAIKTQPEQKRDDYIEFQHYAKDTHSDVQYLSLNKGHVVSQANSLLDVNSQQSESYQDLKHILLNEKARSFSKPNLMIQNPNVMAKHGNNIGSIENNSLEYLQMRGIDKVRGQQIIQKSLMDNFIERHPYHQDIKEIFHDF